MQKAWFLHYAKKSRKRFVLLRLFFVLKNKGGEHNVGYCHAINHLIFNGNAASIGEMVGKSDPLIKIVFERMNAMILLGVVVIVMFIYLTYALLNPEKF
ncbi:K(+)-transporting ATPase subunit F [Bacillus sp. WMMC1349]|uniref:K(+)-transporting ATPase subunit F n=1 Tax=Bacillus sp. WMMC1349 TaxID=2736254 RepID=UPI001C1304DE|nr:K(+)-transporting ATPase subunit F [Bacillus sp. WMMC1349]